MVSGYVSRNNDLTLYAEVVVDGELIDSISIAGNRISAHEKMKHEQPKELAQLLLSLLERVTKKIKNSRGS